MNISVLTVSQLMTYAKSAVEDDDTLKNIYITGEISNFYNNARSGHLYFSLKDRSCVVKCVMFSGYASQLCFVPQDGMKVILNGSATVYTAAGQFQIITYSMQPDGVGSLALAYEQLKQRLEKEGLFDAAHKTEIPEIPKKIGVITSEGGAVIQDIRNVVSRRYPLAEIVLCPVAVQGNTAPPQLTAAVNLFNRLDNVDVIIIGRGGGSFEDLNCFNDEALVRAIYNSHIPVISAVGHETDFTLCDFVSDMRAPTPSAAAELAVPDRIELLNRVFDIYSYLKYKTKTCIEDEYQSLDRFFYEKISAKKPDRYFESEKTELMRLLRDIKNKTKNKINIESTEIKAAANRINALNPMELLLRGYSVTFKEGNTVRSVEEINVNDNITVQLSDGTAMCTVNSIVHGE